MLRQIVAFKTCAANLIRTAENPNDILNTLMKLELANCFPDLVTAYCIFLALSVNDATNERSFSKLKLIKLFLRSTMAQDRLSDLGILSIEKERFSEIDGNAILESFAQTKARKRNFNYCLNTNCVCQLQLCQFVNSVSNSDSICVSFECVNSECDTMSHASI